MDMISGHPEQVRGKNCLNTTVMLYWGNIMCLRALIFWLVLVMPATAIAWPGDVLTVHDGDTVRVQSAEGEAVSIRVYGVDCPELGQPYGAEARDMTSQLLSGQRVEILPAQARKSYKREVAVVMLPDGETLEDALISGGLAWVDGRYCKRPECDNWRQHQANAKAAKRGLWSADNPIPPWTWRRLQRNQKVHIYFQ